MPITTTIPTAAKDKMLGVFSSSRTYKLILLAAGATLGAGATTYSALGAGVEHAATGGYVQGGVTLTGYTRTIQNGVSYIDFSDPVFTGVTVSSDGCAIYCTDTGDIVYVGAYVGGNKGVTGGNFPITFPTADENNALLRAT